MSVKCWEGDSLGRIARRVRGRLQMKKYIRDREDEPTVNQHNRIKPLALPKSPEGFPRGGWDARLDARSMNT